MNKSLTQYFFSLFFVALVILPTTALAQEGGEQGAGTSNILKYNVLESIPGVVQEGESVGTFSSYITGIFNFGIGIVGIAALVMIVIGGFWYVSSAGNQTRVTTAKSIITDAFLGLFVALFAWLLLYTINPSIVEDGLSALRPNVLGNDINVAQNENEDPIAPPIQGEADRVGYCYRGAAGSICFATNAGCENHPGRFSNTECEFFGNVPSNDPPRGGTVTESDIKDCVNCSWLSDVATFDFKNLSASGCARYESRQVSTCSLNTDLITKLNAVHATGMNRFTLTESWPPSVEHTQPCHYNGTCADVSISGPPSSIIEFYRQAVAAGLRPEYEVDDPDTENALIKAFKLAGINNPPVKYVEGIKGDHFSVYN